MKITEDVRQYAKENGYTTEQALEKGMSEKSASFRDSGSNIYS